MITVVNREINPVRNAKVRNEVLSCPYCGSSDICCAELRCNEHEILDVAGKTIQVSCDAENTDPDDYLLRCLLCKDCRKESSLPEGYRFHFIM